MGTDPAELRARIERLRTAGEQLRRDSALLRAHFDATVKDVAAAKQLWSSNRRVRPPPPGEQRTMAERVPAGSDVSGGTYKCINCGYELSVGSTKNLPPCPSCHNGQYETLSGGDSR